MIRNLRAFFLGRLLREKLLLLAFVGIGTLWWLSAFTTRAGAFWRAQRTTTLELADQRQWLAREAVIEADAKKAASRLDPTKTRNRLQLIADVSNLANEAGIRNTNISAQGTVTSGQFSVHTVLLTANGVDWDPLIKKFYPALQAKAPYIGIEQFTLSVPNTTNRMHSLQMRISSVEVSKEEFGAAEFLMNCYLSPVARAAATNPVTSRRIPRLMNLAYLTTRRPRLLALLLLCASPRLARAENSISYKFADYQEMGGRIGVQTQGGFIEQDLGPDTHLKLSGILDSIAGATPSGQPAPAGSTQVPVSQLHEYRKAWNGDLSHQFNRVNLAAGFGTSRESDYISTGWSLNALTDFNQKNTTLLTGVAGTDDTIKVFYQSAWVTKRTNDVIVGVTQLLDPRTSVTVNLSWGRQRGLLADPYKLVQKNTEIIPGLFLPLTFGEVRPMYREKWIALASVNRAFPEAHGAIEGSYRYYNDTFGTDAHTLDLSWFQHVGEKVILKPSFRYYDQTAARFYGYNFNGSPVAPRSGVPNPGGPFYSSDFRLSALRSYTYGFKAVWKIIPRLQVDAGWEWYDMRGKDGVTPPSAYPRARITTLGTKFSW